MERISLAYPVLSERAFSSRLSLIQAIEAAKMIPQRAGACVAKTTEAADALFSIAEKILQDGVG